MQVAKSLNINRIKLKSVIIDTNTVAVNTNGNSIVISRNFIVIAFRNTQLFPVFQ